MASSSASHSAAADSSTAAGSSAYEVVPHNRKAPMWAYFDMVRLIEDSEFKAKCKRCGKLLATKGNSSLLRHANHCNAQSAPEEGQAQISASHSAAAGSSTAAGSSAYEVVPHNRKAPMWAYFDMVRLIEDGEFKAKCKSCGKLLATKGNSSLLRHANYCNAQSAPEEVEDEMLELAEDEE